MANVEKGGNADGLQESSLSASSEDTLWAKNFRGAHDSLSKGLEPTASGPISPVSPTDPWSKDAEARAKAREATNPAAGLTEPEASGQTQSDALPSGEENTKESSSSASRQNLPPIESNESPPARLSTDKPTAEDALGFRSYARAIAQFLTHKESKPPLTISIQAPWGGGKTSMMLMIEDELDPHNKRGPKSKQASTRNDKLTVREFEDEVDERIAGRPRNNLPRLESRRAGDSLRTTVWFNAWMYESTNQVWAGLVDAILEQVPARLSRRDRELFWARLSLSRVDATHVRMALHEYFLKRIFLSSVGWAQALCGALGGLLLGKVGFGSWATGTVFSAAIGVIVKAWDTKMEYKEEAVSEVFKELIRPPAYDKEVGFVHQAASDLSRVFDSLPPNEGLVIFIDDLDRCSPNKVAAVLEAVNLIIAGDFPDCYFVIGMDAEMVAAALDVAHKDLTSAAQNTRTPVGWRFMDKFVQLPFVVPPIERHQETRFLERLSGQNQGAPDLGRRDSELLTTQGNIPEPSFKDLPEFVGLTGKMAALFSGNPRELKRFTNLLRFYWFLWAARRNSGDAVPSAYALACWTAMSVKWPQHVRWLRRVEESAPAELNLRAMFEQEGNEADNSIERRRQNVHGTGDDSQLPSTTSHLGTIESLFRSGSPLAFEEWRDKLDEIYGPNAPSWISDRSLFEFYRGIDALLGPNETLSQSAGKGFW